MLRRHELHGQHNALLSGVLQRLPFPCGDRPGWRKEISDVLGHQAGDELLHGVAGRLRAAVGTPVVVPGTLSSFTPGVGPPQLRGLTPSPARRASLATEPEACRHRRLAAQPTGAVDSYTFAADRVTVAGWIFDRDARAVDRAGLRRQRRPRRRVANLGRGDVAAEVPGGRFRARVPGHGPTALGRRGRLRDGRQRRRRRPRQPGLQGRASGASCTFGLHLSANLMVCRPR
jgi:hypothetical protein